MNIIFTTDKDLEKTNFDKNLIVIIYFVLNYELLKHKKSRCIVINNKYNNY